MNRIIFFAQNRVNCKFRIAYKLTNFKVTFKIILEQVRYNIHVYDTRQRERAAVEERCREERERKRNSARSRPRIETKCACRSNLRRCKYASNAFKVNCISLCRIRIVYFSLRRVTMHNTRKSAHHMPNMQRPKERTRERERETRNAGAKRGKKTTGASLRAHENCMENKLHGQHGEHIYIYIVARELPALCTVYMHTGLYAEI